ncbi:MAG: hypothetical protein WCP65_02945, partial [Bacteroidota bacterium]
TSENGIFTADLVLCTEENTFSTMHSKKRFLSNPYKHCIPSKNNYIQLLKHTPVLLHDIR